MAGRYQFKKAGSSPSTGEEISNEQPQPQSAAAPPPDGRRRRKRSKQNSLELLKMQVFANGDVTPPHQLAREGKLEELKATIENFSLTLKEVDEAGRTMLHAAAETGQVHIMRYLLDSGININAVDAKGNTALHTAVLGNHTEAVCLLLESRGDDTVLNRNQDAALHLLFRSSNKDLIAAFLQYPHIELVIPGYRKRTPLHVIAETDNIEALELLHNSICLNAIFKEKTSFRLCATDEDNLTPIHLAARVGSAKALDSMMCKCMGHGYPPEVVLSFLDEENSTPLHAAVDGGHLAVVEVLLKHGAVPSHIKGDQPPPMHLACSQGKLEMVQVMVTQAGKDILQLHDQFGQTPLHRSASGLNCIGVLSYLISEGVEVNAIDNQGRTPLIYAIFVGSLVAAQELVKHGADPLIKDRQGHNALHVAIHRRRKAIVGFLLNLPIAAQLVIDCDLQSRNPLHIALSKGYGELVPPLVSTIRLQLGSCHDSQSNNFLHLAATSGDHRALSILLDIPSCQTLLNKTNHCGATPLHKAAGEGHAQCVELLLSHGAMSHKCNIGTTPFMYACMNGHTECAQLVHNAFPFQKDWCDDKGNNALHLSVRSGSSCTLIRALNLGVAITHNHEGLSFFNMIIDKPDSKLAMAAVTSSRWQEILDCSSPHRPPPMIGLIQRLPEVARTVLDQCRIQSTLDKQDTQFWVKYNFKYLKLDDVWASESPQQESEDEEEKPEEESALMKLFDQPSIRYKIESAVAEVPSPKCKNVLQVLREMIHYNRVSLLTHPVVKAYIKSKWRDYGRAVYLIYTLLFALQVILVSAFIIITPNPTQEEDSSNQDTGVSLNISGSGNGTGDELKISIASNVVRFLTIFIALLNGVAWFLSTFSLGWHALNFIRNAFVWADLLAILFTIIFLLPVHGHDSALWEIGSIASFFCWFALFIKLQPYDVFGVYVTMFLAITRSVFLVLTVCFLLIAAFSLSLYILMGNIPIFSTVGFSFFTNFGHMLGEVDYTLPILQDKEENLEYGKLTFFFIILVAILMSIVIMNLLIGLAVGDIDKIQRNAIAEQRTLEVSIFTRLDYSMPHRLLQKYNRPSYTSFPNQRRSLPRNIWRIFWHLLKGEDSEDSETGTEIEQEREAYLNLQLTNQLQLMASRLDDLSQVQTNMLAMIQKLQNRQQQEEEEEEIKAEEKLIS